MGEKPNDELGVATALMTAMTRLRARLRTESAPDDMRWTWSQLTTLARVADDGPTTISALAEAEHVRRQSMAETVAALRADGLVEVRNDPSDRRKMAVTATGRGRAIRRGIPGAREAWLDAAVHELLSKQDRDTLLSAAEIMNRLADAEVRLST